jgi:F-type H+-transporting ATPase subunit delta
MAEISTIARPYAEAAFTLADKANTLEVWSKALARLAMIAADADARQAVGNPRLTDEQRYALFGGR